MKNYSQHTFHIPVMGLAFTIDTPIKVAKYGISSVVSIMDDELVEQMREVLSKNQKLVFEPIPKSEFDYRAKRITAYLDLMQTIVDDQFKQLKVDDFSSNVDLKQYLNLLPESSNLKVKYRKWLQSDEENKLKLQEEIVEKIKVGSINVNIMTKLDKANYDDKGVELDAIYSDAHAALRGFANSKLNSSVIFSAGLNPRLYSYCEKFDDFYPDENGVQKKKIILKVSDFRSALIQGKFFAKKGLWISEFRIESGINCGGHAFISNGIPIGQILEEFKTRRQSLIEELWQECNAALVSKARNSFTEMPNLHITTQGGIGTSEENNFLMDYYALDATGWGSLFLLVPEATNVDKETLQLLVNAKKEDYYLSDASPLGVPYNNIRNSTSDKQRLMRIEKNKPGSPCYKKFLSFNTEFTEKPICTASRQYQKLKIDELKSEFKNEELLEKEIDKVLEKDCLCEGLGAAALIKNDAKLLHNLKAVNICPGPNLAYFSDVYSLKQVVDHIYGRINILPNQDRPNLFVNEIQLYLDYLKKELDCKIEFLTEKKLNFLKTFKDNLLKGIEYYEGLLPQIQKNNEEFKNIVLMQLANLRLHLGELPHLRIN